MAEAITEETIMGGRKKVEWVKRWKKPLSLELLPMEVINWEKCLEILVVTIMEANGDTTITIGKKHVLRK